MERSRPRLRGAWFASIVITALLGNGPLEGATTTAANSTSSRGESRGTTAGDLTGFGLPEAYRQQISDRQTIDSYQGREQDVAPGVLPSSRPRYVTPPRVEGAVRIVRATLSPAVEAFRAANVDSILPPRGFRAPILDNQSETWAPRRPTESFTAAEREAANLVEQHLAIEGLLPVLARLLQQFGADACLADVPSAMRRLFAVGYPADLLHHFRLTEAPNAPAASRPKALIELIARRLIAGRTLSAALQEPLPVQFDFQPSLPGASWINPPANPPFPTTGDANNAVGNRGGRFEIATESGEHEIGLLRLQLGGGWREGVIPGGSIDVIGQLVDQFRSTDFLISVAAGGSASLQSMITNSWRLRRRGQVTLCEEATELSAWAQDNGKAGRLIGRTGQPDRLATVVPRFACMDEGKSVFVPGESYLADGLRATGHPVLHSPLLFQGGNLLCVREPRTQRRLLIVGEGTLRRNIALGLSSNQVLAACKVEFSVDECFVLPGLSYHLDFDVTFRGAGSELLAFVNDSPAAARHIVELGVDALRHHSFLTAPEAVRLLEDLKAGRDQAAVAFLAQRLRRERGSAEKYPASVSRAFANDPGDEAAGNLQVFLVGLDVLESGLAATIADNASPGRSAYLAALRRMEQARQGQIAALRQLGCTIVPIPSMHDLRRSINYLNGLQHRSGFVMPAYGGFYTPLDQSAATAFRNALGPQLHVALVRSSQCQRLFGAVHCTAAAYPR